MSQLRELAEPFPPALISTVSKQGRGQSYVSHSTVTERLLSIVGPFDFHITEVVYGDIPEMVTQKTTYPARRGVVGVLATLNASVDGRTVSVTEAGDDENGAMHTDGQALKNAASDALKRCAMRLGLGLHLWSGGEYFLDRQLDAAEAPAAPVVKLKPEPKPTQELKVAAPDKHQPTGKPSAFVRAAMNEVLKLAGDKDIARALWDAALEFTDAANPPTPLQCDRALQYVKENLNDD